jgi:hypothetical protein
LSVPLATAMARAVWWVFHSTLSALLKRQKHLPLAAQHLCCDTLLDLIGATLHLGLAKETAAMASLLAKLKVARDSVDSASSERLTDLWISRMPW